MLTDVPQQTLTDILNLHIVPNTSLKSSEFSDMNLQTLGSSIQLNASDSTLISNGRSAKIIPLNAQATNGILHSLETVLLP
ncbi:fasciclin domain-containing protein [Mesonia maritima]|uniref:fasciclin domain-containing protein n=1 Tax=Mesonia maritima TaxID=1793873 RepID=UPI003625B7F5